MEKYAVISACGAYRYVLRRVWDQSLPPFVMIMLNPSTADDQVDDPTIRRVLGFARREGCGSVIVGNVGAGRSPDPNVWKKMRDPYGPSNEYHLRQMFEECRRRNGVAVAGWGNNAPWSRTNVVKALARDAGVTLRCLGKTKDGNPRHPLYVRADQPLEDL